MVKRGRPPGRSGMAAGAVLAKSAVMVILMAGGTVGRSALKDVVDMAPGTGCADMRTGQLEGRDVMVKRGRFPGRAGMAAGAALAKSTVMAITMAGGTVGRRTLENVVDMAPGAGCTDMCAGQLEGRDIVVERSRFPGRGGMAGGACLPK